MMLIKFLFLPLLLITAATPMARAHAVLMSSVPSVAGRALAGPLNIQLRFNSLIDASRSRISLVDNARYETVLVIIPGAEGNVLGANAVVTPGPHVLRWQVLAVDGHITRGNVPFDVSGARADQDGAARSR